MVGYRVSGASSIWMSFFKYTILTAGQKKKLLTTFTVSNYPHHAEPVVWRASPPSDVAVPIDGPSTDPATHRCARTLDSLSQARTLDVASSNPSWVIYPTGRLRTWPSSVLFWSWRMLESKFTTQEQRCPWVSASSNIPLGLSIWAAIISAHYCFVCFGSRMETLLHFARRQKLFVEEGEWCCAKDNTIPFHPLISCACWGCDLPNVSVPTLSGRGCLENVDRCWEIPSLWHCAHLLDTSSYISDTHLMRFNQRNLFLWRPS